jgi:hypothetical protein
MENNLNNTPFVKQAFGNHDMMRKYLNYLNDPSELPPFLPVLYRSVDYGNINIENIIENERRKHQAINRLIKRELNAQFDVYQQLKIPASAE